MESSDFDYFLEASKKKEEVDGLFSPYEYTLGIRQDLKETKLEYSRYKEAPRLFRQDYESKIMPLLTYIHELTHFANCLGTLWGLHIFDSYARGARVFTWIAKRFGKCYFPLRDNVNAITEKYKERLVMIKQGVKNPSDADMAFHELLYSYFNIEELDVILGEVEPVCIENGSDCNSPLKVEYLRHRRSLLYLQTKKVVSRVHFSMAGKRYTMKLGLNSIFEAFAKSVENEHLLWFNPRIGDKLIDIQEKKPTYARYYLPYLCMMKHIQPRAFSYAFFRVACDIAMMYDPTILEGHYWTDNQKETLDYTHTKTVPSLTFFKVLRAMEVIRPMKDHHADLLRYYDELCHQLRIPSMKEMTERGIEVVEKEKETTRNELQIAYLETCIEALKIRLKYPLFYVNDLIYSNAEGHEELSKLYNKTVIEYKLGSKKIRPFSKEIPFALHFIFVYSICKQYISKNNIVCPLKKSKNLSCPYSKCDTEKCFFFSYLSPFQPKK